MVSANNIYIGFVIIIFSHFQQIIVFNFNPGLADNFILPVYGFNNNNCINKNHYLSLFFVFLIFAICDASCTFFVFVIKSPLAVNLGRCGEITLI